MTSARHTRKHTKLFSHIHAYVDQSQKMPLNYINISTSFHQLYGRENFNNAVLIQKKYMTIYTQRSLRTWFMFCNNYVPYLCSNQIHIFGTRVFIVCSRHQNTCLYKTQRKTKSCKVSSSYLQKSFTIFVPLFVVNRSLNNISVRFIISFNLASVFSPILCCNLHNLTADYCICNNLTIDGCILKLAYLLQILDIFE